MKACSIWYSHGKPLSTRYLEATGAIRDKNDLGVGSCIEANMQDCDMVSSNFSHAITFTFGLIPLGKVRTPLIPPAIG